MVERKKETKKERKQKERKKVCNGRLNLEPRVNTS